MWKAFSGYRGLFLGIIVVCAANFFGATEVAQAAVVTWDGGGGGDTNWNTCTNWSGNACPTSSDVATFDVSSITNTTVNTAVSVLGIDINAGYIGTITQSAGQSVTVGSSNFDQAAGTVTMTDGPVTITGNFVLSGGTFTAPSAATMTVQGAWTHTAGGTFAHNNGTVQYGGSGTKTWDVATTEEFYNLEMNNAFTTGSSMVVATGDTLNVNGTFTVIDGSWTTGTIAAKGAASISSSAGYASLSNGTFLINGSGAQTITIAATATAGYEIVDQFTVNNASATVNGTGEDGTIALDKLTVSAGTMALTSYELSVAEAATVSGGTLSFTTGSPTFASTFAVSSGTFTAGSGTVTHTGAITISGGTYTATSGTTTLAAGFTHTAGGTFTHNSGTWEFTGGGATFDVTTSETFGAVTMNKTNGASLTISSDTIIATGALLLTEGKAQTGTLEAQGDVTLAAEYDASTNVTLTFSGSATQVFTTNGGSNYDGDLVVNKSGGQVTMVGALTLNQTSQDLTIQEGTFDINGYALTVQGAATEKIVVETGGVLRLQGGETITADSASYPQLDSGSTVYYDGTSGPYTLIDYTYHHLVIDGAGAVFTLAANESFGGNVTITAGTLSQGGFTLAVVGTFSNDGTLRRFQTEAFTGTMDVNSGTVEYIGDNDAQETVTITDFDVLGTDYYNLKINDTNATKDIFALGAALTIAGTLQVTSAEFQQGANAISAAALTVNGGTFTGGSSSVGVSNGVTISSGVLTASSGVTTISGGGFTHTAGGTFTHNSGTVAFTGSSSTVDVSSTETFSALTINMTDGQTLTVASGDTLIAVGTLALTNGTWGTGNVQAQGNVTVASTWDAAGTGTLVFGGTAAQSFDLTGATAALDNPVTINKASNTVTLASAYTLDHANADFTLTLGTFSTGDYAITTSSGSDIAVNGGTFNAGASTMTIAGLLTLAGGTYNGNTSTPTFSGAVALTSGAYNGSANGDTFGGGLTISGGTFTASDATTTVSGAWTHTAGGTFTHNSGTVAFTGTAATADVATSETFSSLTVNKNNGQTLTIASGDSFVVVGTLTLTNGAVGTGTLEAQGGVSVGSGFDGGNAPLKFSGTSAQTFTLTGATGKFDGDIEVAKSSNTVSLGSDLVMDAEGQDMTVTSGTFSTSDSNYGLTVAGNVAANGGTLALNGSTADLNGNLTIGGGTVNMGSATVTLVGNVTYTSGTMTPGTSTVTLDGGSQEFTGATTWNNLTKNTLTAVTLTLPSNVATTIGGTLTLSGQDGALLSLRSSTSGQRHTLTVSGSATYNYLDVKDSEPSATLTCLTTTNGCVDSGGNHSYWKFRNVGGSTAPSMVGGASSAGTVSDTPAPTTVGGYIELYAPDVTVLAPNGGESYAAGAEVNIVWSTKNNVSLVNVAVSVDGGKTWDVLDYAARNQNVYTWEIPDETTSTVAMVRIEATDLASVTAEDTSDAVFTIASGDTIVGVDDGTFDGHYEEDATEIAERIADLPSDIAIHGLVKLPDDGDATTQVDSAVYYVGADGKRHAFPNELVFKTWFCDFSDVQVITEREMADIVLGANVVYRPGTKMVKFLSVPKVYAVDRFGELHWVTSEATATALYGTTWNTQIDDLSDAFFGNYEFGDDIASADDYDPIAAEMGVAYPSDNIPIPGYSSAPASEGLVCGE